MNIPVEFLEFTEFFHQDFDVFYSDERSLIEDAIGNTPPENYSSIKNFLDELLSGKYSEAQLRSIWRDTKAEISPFRGQEGNCTEFLKNLRSYF
jgi:hypothetical protein